MASVLGCVCASFDVSSVLLILNTDAKWREETVVAAELGVFVATGLAIGVVLIPVVINLVTRRLISKQETSVLNLFKWVTVDRLLDALVLVNNL